MVAQIAFYGGGSLIFLGIGWLVNAILPDAAPRSLRTATAVLTSLLPVAILASAVAVSTLHYGIAASNDPKLAVLITSIVPFALPATLGTWLGVRTRYSSRVPDYPGLRR